MQGDGKIVAAGSFFSAERGETSFALARYNPERALETTFDSDGRVTTGAGLTAGKAGSGSSLTGRNVTRRPGENTAGGSRVVSQSRTVLSSDPDISCRPSGE